MPLFTRYSDKPQAIATWTDFACGAEEGGRKPKGRWFCIGCGDDWKIYVLRRVAAGDWDKCCLDFHTQVIFRPTANLRRIDDRADMEGFTRQYGCETKQAIDWIRVGKEFDGIIISLNPKAYPSPHWYDCWCVPSGCVWRISAAVQELKPLNYQRSP